MTHQQHIQKLQALNDALAKKCAEKEQKIKHLESIIEFKQIEFNTMFTCMNSMIEEAKKK